MSIDVVEKLQKQSVRLLNGLLQETLREAEKGVVDQIGAFLSLSQNKDEVLVNFVENMNDFFDSLLGKESVKSEPAVDFESLSLVLDDELEEELAETETPSYLQEPQLPAQPTGLPGAKVPAEGEEEAAG